MKYQLTASEQKDLLARGFSRRNFGKILSLVGAGAVTLPFYNEAALAQGLSMVKDIPADAVKINANENPMGPCPEAADAIHSVIQKGGRYMYDETDKMANTLAAVEGLKPDYVLPFPGSSDPLHRAVLAFTSPERSLVIADPGYEAGPRAAASIGAKTIFVPLRADYKHDVKAMVEADPKAGVIYICNPNNPTGTVNSKEDIEYALANKPAGSILLLDEAYTHISLSAVPGSYLVAQDKDIIILRTFSKLYGMAGLRAGAALARPDLLAKLRFYGTAALPITGMVGATASLRVKNLVAQRRKQIGEIREDTLAFLDKNNVKYIPSESNKFMVDVKMPGKVFSSKMVERKVYVGRTWPSLPTYVRVTVGTRDEMAKFKDAFLKCYNS